MSTEAPAVVALVVATATAPGGAGAPASGRSRGAGGPAGGQATAPGGAGAPASYLEGVLGALAAQDYPNFSVLVVAPGELAGRVAACLPEAHFSPLPEGAGFAEGANLGMSLVEGAAHVLICHDDVALAPDALRLLVEEAYRSNAGLTCPKLVSWEEPYELLSVGMAADRWGMVHSLVEPGELDQGQHDAVREVFVAPTTAVLVRSDLWSALGGLCFGDLDLCWRAQMLGARVIVAPQAVARHLCACRPQPAMALEADRLRTLWTCYGPFALALVAPAAVAFSLFEAAWRLARSPHRHAGEPLAALGWSLRKPKALLQARRRAQHQRRRSDWSLWKAQGKPSSQLRAALRERVERAATLAGETQEAAARGVRVRGARGAGGRLPGPGKEGAGARWATPLGRSWLAFAGICLAVLLVAGSRGLLSGPLPLVGQLPSTGGGVSGWWQAWWSGPGTSGLGAVPFGPPALFIMGLLGLLCLGSAAVAAHLVVLAPLVIGPLGAYVGSRRLLALAAGSASERGPLAAGALYAALPVAYNAIARGHLAGLVSYAAAPWLLAGLSAMAVSPQPPYRLSPKKLAGLALIAAIAGAFAPATLLMAPVMGAAVAAGSLLAGRPQNPGRPLACGLAVGAAAFVVLLPWSAGTSLASTGGARPSLAALVRLQTGPFGGSWLGWAFIVAAAVSVFVGRGGRLTWAVRTWAVAMTFLALAWAWSPPGGPEELLAPAGAALAFSVALGAASVELDLPGYRFGWRQFAPALGVAAALGAVLSPLAWAAGGRWDLPASGAEAAYAFPPPHAGAAYRVLWVGPPGSLPLAPQGRTGGLGFGASLDGLPVAAQLWPGAPSRLANWVGQSLAWAEAGETSDLGHLLGLAGVRYVAVPAVRADQALLATLSGQVDLEPVGIDPAYAVYENSAWLPVVSPVPRQLVPAALARSAREAASLAMRVPAGQAGAYGTYASVPPGTSFLLVSGRRLPARSGAVGSSVWPGYLHGRVVSAGAAGEHLAAGVTLALWVATALAALWRKKPSPGREAEELEPAAGERQLVLAGKGQ